MKRTPLRPGLKPLKRGELRRGRPLGPGTRPLKTRKVSKRFAKRRCRPYLDWLKLQPCCMTGKRTGQWFAWQPKKGFTTVYHPFKIVVDPAHVRGRGAGGDDLYNAVPLAHHLHDELHQHGPKTFAKKYGVGLAALALTYTERFLTEHPERGEFA